MGFLPFLVTHATILFQMPTPSRKKKKKYEFLKGIENKKTKEDQIDVKKPTDTEASKVEAKNPDDKHIIPITQEREREKTKAWRK